jgi:hypothetical protein
MSRYRTLAAVLGQWAVASLLLAVPTAIWPAAFAAPGPYVEEVAPHQLRHLLVLGVIRSDILGAAALLLSMIVAVLIAPKAPRWIWLILPLICFLFAISGIFSGFREYGFSSWEIGVDLGLIAAIVVGTSAGYLITRRIRPVQG